MNDSLKIYGASALSLAIGAFVGYKVAEKKLADLFEERLAQETKEMRVFYSTVKKKYDTPEEAVADLIPETNQDPREPAQKVQYHKLVKEAYVDIPDDEAGAKAAADLEEVDKAVRQNVFDKNDSNDPYVIDQETFMQNDPGYDQVTLTYYENDKVLLDSRDDIIDDVKKTVGVDFFNHFGKGSSDPNVTHIRNESLRMDFEICRSEGDFAKDVLGETGED